MLTFICTRCVYFTVTILHCERCSAGVTFNYLKQNTVKARMGTFHCQDSKMECNIEEAENWFKILLHIWLGPKHDV
jgi:hypothetical protein